MKSRHNEDLFNELSMLVLTANFCPKWRIEFSFSLFTGLCVWRMSQMVPTDDSHISVFIFSAFCSLPFPLLNTDPSVFFRQFYFSCYRLYLLLLGHNSEAFKALWGFFCLFCFMWYSPSQAMAIFTDPVLLTHIYAFVIACAVRPGPPFCHLTNGNHSESCPGSRVRKCRLSHVLLLQYSYVKDEHLYCPNFCRKKKAS